MLVLVLVLVLDVSVNVSVRFRVDVRVRFADLCEGVTCSAFVHAGFGGRLARWRHSLAIFQKHNTHTHARTHARTCTPQYIQ